MDRRKDRMSDTASGRWAEHLARIADILDRTGLDKVEKWGSDVYTFDGKNIVSYGAFKHYVAIWFYNGVFLSDPLGVLINANEKVTRSLRQWRMTALEEIDEGNILRYVREAIELERQGRRLKALPFTPVPVPTELQARLDEDEELRQAFDRLTPGRQKEYSLHVAEAKREATRMQRVEKAVPMILAGIGLNDKYKK